MTLHQTPNNSPKKQAEAVAVARRSTPRTTAIFIALALLLVSALLIATTARGGEESVVDGVTWVKNSDTPAEGVETVRLEELWRVGGLDDEENIFGVIQQAIVHEDNIYLMDGQLAEVKVFDMDGELVRIIGREGDGPGEFRQPSDMCFLPDGTLGVMQSFPGRVIKLNTDGTPAGNWALGDPSQGSFFIMRGIKHGNGVVTAGGVQQSIDQAAGLLTRERFLSILSADGMRETTLVSSPVVVPLTEFRLDELELIDGPDRRYDVARDGSTVVGIPFDRYEVSIFGPDGELERVFTREYDSWKRNEQATGIWRRILETIERTQAPGAAISFEEYEPDIELLRVADDGSVWILSSRAMWESPDDIFTSYDVFTPEGHFQKQVRVICEGNPRADLLFFSGDRAFMVIGFFDAALAQFGGAGAAAGDEEEAEPMSIICYQIAD